MTLHVTFFDGSSPWVFFGYRAGGNEKAACLKEFHRLNRKHKKAIFPVFVLDHGVTVEGTRPAGRFAVFYRSPVDGFCRRVSRWYSRPADALREAERFAALPAGVRNLNYTPVD